MKAKEHLENPLKRNDRGVELDLNHLRVPGPAPAYLGIGGTSGASSRIPDRYLLNSLQCLENRLQAPKASAAECCTFQFIHRYLLTMLVNQNRRFLSAGLPTIWILIQGSRWGSKSRQRLTPILPDFRYVGAEGDDTANDGAGGVAVAESGYRRPKRLLIFEALVGDDP